MTSSRQSRSAPTRRTSGFPARWRSRSASASTAIPCGARLAELSERGLVRAERGSGTYVARSRLAYPIGARTRFSEIVGSAGRDPGGRLIGHGSESAAPDIARRLGLKVGEAVVRLDILRSADRVPICWTTNWLPAARAADAARVFRASRSITATLAHFGIKDYRRQSTRITAAAADALDAERLHLVPGAPF